MASLTEISIVSRKIIRYGIYAIILIVIARYAFIAGVSIYKKLFPAPPPEPTVAFGKLPSIPFPEKEAKKGLNFTLETPDGKLPAFPDQLEVYFMPPIASDIKVVDAAREKAQKLEFDSAGKPIVESIQNVYIFPKRNVPSTLTMNIITGVFSISYDINANPSVLNGIVPEPKTMITDVRSYFSSVASQEGSDDINKGIATYELLRVDAGKFVKVDALSDADLIKVNLFRENWGSKKDIVNVTPEMPEANIWAIVAPNRTYIAAEYHYFPIDKGKLGTYPIKGADEAWEDLKSGKSFIANLGSSGKDDIKIRRVYLAYYDSGAYTEFYQPVFVFEGDGGFYGYVPAVKSEFYGAEKEKK